MKAILISKTLRVQKLIAMAFCGERNSTVNGQISCELFKFLTGLFGNNYFEAHFLKMRSVSLLISSKENVSSVFRELYPSKTSETNFSSVIRAGNGSFFDLSSKGNLCSAIERTRRSLIASERLRPNSSNKAAAFCFVSSATRTLRKVFELDANNFCSPLCTRNIPLNKPVQRRSLFSLLLLVSLVKKQRLKGAENYCIGEPQFYCRKFSRQALCSLERICS